jgi:hypothetical protein
VAGSKSPTLVRRRDMVTLLCLAYLCNTRRGFFESPAPALEFEQVTVVHEPVKDGGYHDGITEEPRPVVERPVLT